MPESPFHRHLPLLLAALVAAAYVAVQRWGTDGAIAALAMFLLALPLLLRPAAGALAVEADGVVFVFCVASYAEVADAVLGWNQRVSTAILAVGALFLARRWRDTAAALRSPLVITMGLFLVQQIASAALLNEEALPRVAPNRIAMLLALIGATVLGRRPAGAALLPAVAIVGVLASLPVMMRQLDAPEVLATSNEAIARQLQYEVRPGGLYQQANNAGAAFTFAAAFALAMPARNAQRAALVMALVLGVLIPGSRGAFAVLVAVMAVAFLRVRLRRLRPITVLLGAGVIALLFVVRGPLAAVIVETTAPLEQDLPAIVRLHEVVLAMGGSTQSLMEDDSQRFYLVTESIRLIGETPLFGRGTSNFAVSGGLRSHMQILEVLGENGIVGGLLYGFALVALIGALRRAAGPLRPAAFLGVVAWLATHLDNHNMAELRFMVLPLAMAAALDRGARADEPRRANAGTATEGA